MEEEIEKRKSKLNKFFFGWIKDNYDKFFLIILIFAFVIRLYLFFKTMDQPFWWDEADYLSTGKRLGLGLDIRDIWYYRRGFLFPLISALFFRLGLGEIGIRFLIVLFSGGIIAVSYFIITKMFNKKIALLTSIGLSASWILLFFTGRILTDIPAAFFILLSLFLFWKGYVLKEGNKFLYLFGLFFALAVLTRMQSLMLAPPFLIYIFFKERLKIFKNKKLWITLGIFLLLLLPYFIIYSMHYGNPLGDISSHYLGVGEEAIETGYQRTFSMDIFNYFKDLPYMMTISIFVMLIIGIFYFFIDLFIGFDKIFKSELLQNKFFVLIWILSLFLIMGYIGSVSYVEQRYITAGLPFLFLIAMSPFILIDNLITKHFHINKKISLFFIFIIIALLFIPNITLTNSILENKKNSYLEVKQAGEWIKENSNPKDIIISDSLPQITYYSERSTYAFEIYKDGMSKRDAELMKYPDGEEGFNSFIEDKKPKYAMISVFETHDDWVYSYPKKYSDIMVPVQAFYSADQKPLLIIYEFKYPN